MSEPSWWAGVLDALPGATLTHLEDASLDVVWRVGWDHVVLRVSPDLEGMVSAADYIVSEFVRLANEHYAGYA